jgi:molecular chaperone Hsp33
MNIIRRFLFKDLDIRGQHLSINQVWRAMIKDRGYSKQVRQLFGELSALAIMLANGMKHKGKLTMQLQGNGIVSLLLAEVTHDLQIRGMVRANGAIADDSSFDQILGEGQIVVTLYNAQTDHSFQSLVPRNPKGLIQTFEDYFAQSEQLDSKLWVSSTQDNLSAMLVQKMPVSKSYDEEDWHRITALSSTITKSELCDLDAEQLLHRLFYEETVELFEDNIIDYECQQDRKSVV